MVCSHLGARTAYSTRAKGGADGLPESRLVLPNSHDHWPFLKMVEPLVVRDVPVINLIEAQGEKRT